MIPTTPTLPVDPGIVTSPKEFSDSLTTDLTDDEIKMALQITLPIRRKWSDKFRSKFGPHMVYTSIDQAVEDALDMADDFEDELKYELATKLNLLVHVDIEPIFMGEPPIISFEGALPSHSTAKHGFDHEKKEYEVKKAKDQGEDFLGIGQLTE